MCSIIQMRGCFYGIGKAQCFEYAIFITLETIFVIVGGFHFSIAVENISIIVVIVVVPVRIFRVNINCSPFNQGMSTGRGRGTNTQ